MSPTPDIFAVPRDQIDADLADQRDAVAFVCHQINTALADIGVIDWGDDFARPGGPQQTLVTFRAFVGADRPARQFADRLRIVADQRTLHLVF